jgi:hypothetical protein
VSIQKEAMRTISFCWSPKLPLTSMQKTMTAFDSGTSRRCQDRYRRSSRMGMITGFAGS